MRGRHYVGNYQARTSHVFQALAAVVESIIALVVIFGFQVSVEQQAGIVTAIVGMGQLIAAIVGRTYVTPTSDPRDDYGHKMRTW